MCTGVDSDEAAPASLLLSKTAEQRYLIWWHYRIARESVGTRGCRDSTQDDDGLGTMKEYIYPVVMSRSNAEIAQLKTFQGKYGDETSLSPIRSLSSGSVQNASALCIIHFESGMTGELSGDLKKVTPTAMRVEMGKFNSSLHTSAND
ncbi:hypothetical protein PF001_g31351, partial [Phytophthora fragariae]